MGDGVRRGLDTELDPKCSLELWGIGRKLSAWCIHQGITNALELRDADEGLIRKKMGIVGVRIKLELQGKSCLPLEECPSPKQETCVSRSFSKSVTSLTELKESVAHYITRAAEKLRDQKQVAAAMNVFARTSRHIDDPQVGSITIELPVATNDTSELLHYGMRLVEKIYRKGVPYKKAGVLMMGLQAESAVQISLFDTRDREKSDRLMEVMDNLNDELKLRKLAVWLRYFKICSRRHQKRMEDAL